MSVAAAALEVDAISVRFGGLLAIESMTFGVAEGEIVSLIGPNGAGKTTAFNAITGYLQPTSGEVRFHGQRLNGLKVSRIAALGLVRTFQKTSLFGGNTVFENVLIGLHRDGRQGVLGALLRLPAMRAEEARLRARAHELLDFVGLAARAGERADSLAYGEQRILEVAVALAAQPQLLLLDEPASGMNASETASLVELIGRIRANGTTILLVEHDMRMVMDISDRVVVLNQGHIIAAGAPDAIRRDPEVIRAYLGRAASHA